VWSTSRDLSLSWEQKPISQALDMYVAQRAQAFVGNGLGVPDLRSWRAGTDILRDD
jgi:hypothetical protein